MEGLVVAVGRCVPGGAALRPFMEVMLELFGSTPPTLPGAGIFRAVLRRLWPVGPSSEEVGSPDSILVVGEAVREALRLAAGDTGLLLVLEDLHWADAETLAVVEYLVDHRDAGVSCLLTLRPDNADAWQFARRLASRAATMLQLPPLTTRDATALGRGVLGVPELPDALVEELHAAAGGVPLLIEEVLRAALSAEAVRVVNGRVTVNRSLSGIVPDTVAGMVASRMEALGPEVVATLQAAALLGRDFPVEPLASATGLTPDDTLEALRRATKAGLLRDRGHAWLQFHHALTRDAIVGALIGPERAALARRLLPAVGDRVDVAIRAELGEEAGDAALAVGLRCELARTAARQGALVAAEAEARRARDAAGDDAWLRADVAELALEVAASAGKADEATAAGDEAVTLLIRLGAPVDRLARMRAHMARAHLLAGRLDEALAQLRRAYVEAGEDTAVAAELDVLQASLALVRGDAITARRMAERGRLAAERDGKPDLVCEALEILGQCDRTEDFRRAAATFAAMLETATVHDLPYRRLRALTHLGAVDLHVAGRRDRLEAARQLAEQQGAVAAAAEVDIQTVFLLGVQFRLDEATAVATRAAETCKRYGLALLPLARVQQAALSAWKGRRADMEAYAAGALRIAPEDPTIASLVWGDCRGMLALFEDDRAAALRNLERSVAYPIRYETAAAPSRGVWALLRTIEDIDGQGARDAVRSVGAHDAWWNVALLRYSEAVALARIGDHAAATQTIADADAFVQSHQGGDWVVHLAHRLLGEVALADGWGDPRRWLSEAADFWETRHPMVASVCRSLLRRAGVPVPRRSRAGPPIPSRLRAMGVTSRETEVLHLIAGGNSNREIAQRLYLSRRTVEKHVESLLRKTGSGGRLQLALLAHRVSDDATVSS